jgi:hypothetical protein
MIILVFDEVVEMIFNGIRFNNEYFWNTCCNCNNRELILLRSAFLLSCKCGGSVSLFKNNITKNNITTILCA